MKIELPVRIKAKTVPIEELFETFNREAVLGYCELCNNFGENYSCPGFDFDEERLLRKFPWVTLILTEVTTRPLIEQWAGVEKKKFESAVFDHYGEGDVYSAISMQAFNRIKDQMADLLLLAEKDYAGSLSSPPGSCTKCEICGKALGKACISPENLRYSLEAYGFMVSEIYDRFFNQKLEWTKAQLPDAYHSCSGLFTLEPMVAKIIEGRVQDQCGTIELSYKD